MPFLVRRLVKASNFTGEVNFPLEGNQKRRVTLQFSQMFLTWWGLGTCPPPWGKWPLVCFSKHPLDFPSLSQWEFLRHGRERDLVTFKAANPFVVSTVDFAVASVFQWRFLIERRFRSHTFDFDLTTGNYHIWPFGRYYKCSLVSLTPWQSNPRTCSEEGRKW